VTARRTPVTGDEVYLASEADAEIKRLRDSIPPDMATAQACIAELQRTLTSCMTVLSWHIDGTDTFVTLAQKALSEGEKALGVTS
jgi:hypothetical protein